MAGDNIVDVNTGTEVVLAGKTYRMTPMTIGGFKRVAAHIKANRRQDIKELLDTLPESKERTAMIRELSATPTDADVMNYLSTIDGAMFAMFISISANHPEFTMEVFDNLSQDELLSLKAATKDNVDAPEKNEAGAEVVA